LSPYQHFFWSYAIFYRKPWAWKVGLGAVFPDLIYMVAFFPKLFSYQSFHVWMMDPLWDKVWNSLAAKSVHSFTIWGMAWKRVLLDHPFSNGSPPAYLGWRKMKAIDQKATIIAI
jgi:hypothetical protein